MELEESEKVCENLIMCRWNALKEFDKSADFDKSNKGNNNDPLSDILNQAKSKKEQLIKQLDQKLEEYVDEIIRNIDLKSLIETAVGRGQTECYFNVDALNSEYSGAVVKSQNQTMTFNKTYKDAYLAFTDDLRDLRLEKRDAWAGLGPVPIGFQAEVGLVSAIPNEVMMTPDGHRLARETTRMKVEIDIIDEWCKASVHVTSSPESSEINGIEYFVQLTEGALLAAKSPNGHAFKLSSEIPHLHPRHVSQRVWFNAHMYRDRDRDIHMCIFFRGLVRIIPLQAWWFVQPFGSAGPSSQQTGKWYGKGQARTLVVERGFVSVRWRRSTLFLWLSKDIFGIVALAKPMLNRIQMSTKQCAVTNCEHPCINCLEDATHYSCSREVLGIAFIIAMLTMIVHSSLSQSFHLRMIGHGIMLMIIQTTYGTIVHRVVHDMEGHRRRWLGW